MTTRPLHSQIEKILALRDSYPKNLALQCFDMQRFDSLSLQAQSRFIHCLKSSLDMPESEMGCYAGNSNDYSDFAFFFRKVISAYHKVSPSAQHINDWDRGARAGDSTFDIASLSLPALSLRARAARNIRGFALPSTMNREQRVKFENSIHAALEPMIRGPVAFGRYLSLTPGHPEQISQQSYLTYVKKHLMFRNMQEDDYLRVSGIADDWPYGRGCYLSEDRGLIIWIGEEDHLRVMCMQHGTVLNDVYDRLRNTLDLLESDYGLTYSHSNDFGYLTSCPTNLGTAMRLSIHLPLPGLTRDGSEIEVKTLAESLSLSVRGVDGEHTAMGAGGILDISPRQRFGCTEADILATLFRGIEALQFAEQRSQNRLD